MNAAIPGGLAGKARRVRNRSRAARLYAQQLIEDYFEPDPTERRRSRSVPICGRSDFLPTAVRPEDTPSGDREAQLELALAEVTTPSPAELPISEVVAMPARPAEVLANTVIRFPRTAEPCAKPLLKPPQQFRPRREKFTFGGFLLGCAMGSAAAALVLLVVQTVIQ